MDAVERRLHAEAEQKRELDAFAAILETATGMPVKIGGLGVVFEKGGFASIVPTPIYLEGAKAYSYSMHIVPGTRQDVLDDVRKTCAEHGFGGAYTRMDTVPWRDGSALKVDLLVAVA